MFWPEAMLFLIIEKNASTDAETSALSIPVFSAIWLITSALVTGYYLKYDSKIRGGKFKRRTFKRKMNLLIITMMGKKRR
jgi:hypothetical protein